MEKNKNPKLLLLAFAALMLGIFGVSKLGLTSTIPGLNQEKLALSESNNENICSPENKAGKGVSLFVSCAGFLE